MPKTNDDVALFINQNGMVNCAKHGGGYLQSELATRPNAQVIDTPLDNWVRIPAAEVAEDDIKCETALFGNGFGGECA